MLQGAPLEVSVGRGDDGGGKSVHCTCSCC